jgi:putative spermidine/putrescine transport system ATP-binding protein
MAFLELAHISKHFGRVAAVDDVSLAIQQGEFLTLLGPSGCGKTTMLRMIAGFETPDTGDILLDGESITARPANKRPMGMVFQSYALFPHMTAAQNIAFGMTMQHKPKDYIARRCTELLELVGLGEMERRYPHQMSGGQQQRVALARALAVEPKVLLLDEPLSALDAKVRVSLRNEIRRIQQQLKMTAIYVTHDQEEALSLSDRIAVLARGKIEQLDQPELIYSNPKTAFAATFVGTSNQFRGTLESAADGLCRVGERTFHVVPQPGLRNEASILLVIRPEDVTVQTETTNGVPHLNNTIDGIIELRTFLGPFTRLQVRSDDDRTLTADIANQQARAYLQGQRITLSFEPSACKVLPLDEAEVELVQMITAETV